MTDSVNFMTEAHILMKPEMGSLGWNILIQKIILTFIKNVVSSSSVV